jgi:RNA polymerase sigma-70 factor, ECF subfamily
MTMGHIATLRDPVRNVIDSRLLAAVRNQDRSALEKLYMEYHSYLVRFLARCTFRRDEMEEIIDDTFVTLWSRAEHLPRESKVFTSILGIAYSAAMRALQLESHRRTSRCSEGSRFTVPDLADASASCDELSRSIGFLRIEQRATLSLAYDMSCSLEEIAQITQCTLRTVHSRMSLARAHLREWAVAAGSDVSSTVSTLD